MKLPKGWFKDKDTNFPQNTLICSEDETFILEVSPDFKPPFKSKRPDEWMFSVWKHRQIIRKYNKVFLTKKEALKYAYKWIKDYAPLGDKGN